MSYKKRAGDLWLGNCVYRICTNEGRPTGLTYQVFKSRSGKDYSWEPCGKEYCYFEQAQKNLDYLENIYRGKNKPAEQEKQPVTKKLRNLAAFIDDELTTVSVIFENSNNSYTYVASKELAKTLETGDQVLVRASGALKVVSVVEVHAESEVDVDAGFGYSVIIQKVDHTEHNKIEARLSAGESALRSQQRAQYRAQIKENLNDYLLECK